MGDVVLFRRTKVMTPRHKEVDEWLQERLEALNYDDRDAIVEMLEKAEVPVGTPLTGLPVIIEMTDIDEVVADNIIDILPITPEDNVFAESCEITFVTVLGYLLTLSGDIRDPFNYEWEYCNPEQDGTPCGIPGQCEVEFAKPQR